MNFKPELLAKVLAGEKTQTRRPVKPGDLCDDAKGVVHYYHNGGPDRARYQIGKIYAACPGRGKHQLGRIRLLDIRQEDVRDICTEDVIAEGFQDHLEFFKVWCGFYDPLAYKFLCAVNDPLRVHDQLSDRPANLYDAWALTFELVKPETAPKSDPKLAAFVAEHAGEIAALFR